MSYFTLFFAVIIGYIIVNLFKSFFDKEKVELKYTSFFLAFSGAFLLSITLFELLPKVFENSSKQIGLYIMGGILLQLFLDFFSKGAEHGHIHSHAENSKFPWLLFISLSLHALLEGFPTTNNNSILIGVLAHKIPIAVILTIFFNKAHYKKTTTFIFLLLFATMSPIGHFISSEISFIRPYEVFINALAIGIFLHVSTTILFESSKDHKFNFSKLLAIILGVVIAYLI